MIELHKIKNQLGPPVMDSMVNSKNITSSIRNLQEFSQKERELFFNGLETISYCAPQLWRLLPEEIKQRNTINLFKSDIKQWIFKKCPCRLNELYMIHLAERRHMFDNNKYKLNVNIITIIFSFWCVSLVFYLTCISLQPQTF